jgi:hypothetical protein
MLPIPASPALAKVTSGNYRSTDTTAVRTAEATAAIARFADALPAGITLSISGGQVLAAR